MTIYLDIVLLENLCMNYIILFATGIIIKQNIKHIRILIASLIGGVYAVLSFMQILEIYSNIILKIVLSIVMVYLSFNAKNGKILIKQLLIFYLTSFAFGGCAFALLYFIKPEEILMRNGLYIGTYPIKIALLGGLIGFITITTAFRLIKTRISKKNMFCNVKINFKENIADVKALIDTGNMLKDPITSVPVVVVESKALKGILPSNILDNIEKIIGGDYEDIITSLEKEEYISRFRVIPFTSLGKEHGLLLGFKADSIFLDFEDQEKKVQNVIIGIYHKVLSTKKTYNALIGLDVIENNEEVKINEYITNVKI